MIFARVLFNKTLTGKHNSHTRRTSQLRMLTSSSVIQSPYLGARTKPTQRSEVCNWMDCFHHSKDNSTRSLKSHLPLHSLHSSETGLRLVYHAASFTDKLDRPWLSRQFSGPVAEVSRQRRLSRLIPTPPRHWTETAAHHRTRTIEVNTSVWRGPPTSSLPSSLGSVRLSACLSACLSVRSSPSRSSRDLLTHARGQPAPHAKQADGKSF